MPRYLTKWRKQKAVLRESSGYDDNGEYKVGSATEIDVRWENKQVEALDPEGNTIAIDALVHVDEDIAIGSVMWLGELDDITDGITWMEVVTISKVPDLKGRKYRRVVGLKRYSTELPAAS